MFAEGKLSTSQKSSLLKLIYGEDQQEGRSWKNLQTNNTWPNGSQTRCCADDLAYKAYMTWVCPQNESRTYLKSSLLKLITGEDQKEDRG